MNGTVKTIYDMQYTEMRLGEYMDIPYKTVFN